MGREDVVRPTRKVTPSAPVASVNNQTVPVQTQAQTPVRSQQKRPQRNTQRPQQSQVIPQAHAESVGVPMSQINIQPSNAPIQRGESLEGYHQRIDPLGYAEGIMQYGGTEQQPETFTSDPKPSPRGTTVRTVDGQVTATDKSFSLKEGEYGTLTDTGTVPIRHIEQEPMSMTHAQPPPDLTPAEEKVPNASIVTPNLKDINSFKQSFERPTPPFSFLNPKYDKKRKGYYTDVQLGFFDPPAADIEQWGSEGREYYYTGQGDRDDYRYSEKEVERKTWLGEPYTHTIETSPWQLYTGEEKVMGAKVVEKKHDSPLMISGWWERKGQPVVYEGGQYDDWKMLQQARATNKKYHDEYMLDFFNTEKKQRRKDKFFSHHLEDPNKKKVFDIGGWWH